MNPKSALPEIQLVDVLNNDGRLSTEDAAKLETDPGKPNALLINVQDRNEKVQQIAPPLLADGFNLIRAVAITPQDFQPNAYEAYLDRESYGAYVGRRVSEGELACFLSHMTLWKLISHLEVPYALIFEDDMTLSDGVKLRRDLSLAFKALEDENLGRDDRSHVVKLSVHLPKSVQKRSLEDQRGLYRFTTCYKNAGAYALTPKSAECLQNKATTVMPLDHFLYRPWRRDIDYFFIGPLPTHEVWSESTLGERELKFKPWQRGWHAFAEFKRQVQQTLYLLKRPKTALTRKIDPLVPHDT